MSQLPDQLFDPHRPCRRRRRPALPGEGVRARPRKWPFPSNLDRQSYPGRDVPPGRREADVQEAVRAAPPATPLWAPGCFPGCQYGLHARPSGKSGRPAFQIDALREQNFATCRKARYCRRYRAGNSTTERSCIKGMSDRQDGCVNGFVRRRNALLLMKSGQGTGGSSEGPPPARSAKAALSALLDDRHRRAGKRNATRDGSPHPSAGPRAR